MGDMFQARQGVKYLDKLILLLVQTLEAFIPFSKGSVRTNGGEIADGTISEGGRTRAIVGTGVD